MSCRIFVLLHLLRIFFYIKAKQIVYYSLFLQHLPCCNILYVILVFIARGKQLVCGFVKYSILINYFFLLYGYLIFIHVYHRPK